MNQPGEVPMPIHKAIKRFERAVERHAFMGAQMPHEHPAIEQEYGAAKASLLRKIARLTLPKETS